MFAIIAMLILGALSIIETCILRLTVPVVAEQGDIVAIGVVIYASNAVLSAIILYLCVLADGRTSK
jgi:hypothetical protein